MGGLLLDELLCCAALAGDGDFKQDDPVVEPERELCLFISYTPLPDRGGADGVPEKEVFLFTPGILLSSSVGDSASPDEFTTEGNWNIFVLDFALIVSIIRKSMLCCFSFVFSSFVSFVLKCVRRLLARLAICLS